MTTTLITTINRWLGLSSDTKPTSAPAGSTFYETDTQDTYIWNGSAWSLYEGLSGGELEGLYYEGTITAVVAATSLTVAGLAGKGTNFFAPSDGDMWTIYVLEADGAAPSGEYQKCTGYTTASGLFTYGHAFSAEPAIGDRVILLHPHIAATVPKIEAVQGGSQSIQSVMDTLDQQLDLADVSESAGDITMDGTEQTLYEQSSDHPFFFPGGFVKMDGLMDNDDEDYEIKVYEKVDGTNYDCIWYCAFEGGVTEHDSNLGAIGVPCADPTDGLKAMPQGFYPNGNAVKVTMKQTTEGSGYQTVYFFLCDAQR